MATIRINKDNLDRLISESVSSVVKENRINEAESYGWEVPDELAEEAYELFCKYEGKENADSAIVKAMGQSAKAQILAYIFRMYDFREWQRYMEAREEGATVDNFEFD